ncbi:hypothetical protein VpasPP24_41 [Vibrio phage Vpas_PP24]|nr:hypothetical protein VpasPP24_41 [Vibrio phage Vpas_PP24]
MIIFAQSIAILLTLSLFASVSGFTLYAVVCLDRWVLHGSTLRKTRNRRSAAFTANTFLLCVWLASAFYAVEAFYGVRSTEFVQLISSII